MIIIYEKILVAIDGSFHASNAAEQAAEFYKKWKSKVVIFHSTKHHKIPLRIYPYLFRPIEIYSKMEKASKRWGEQLLNKSKEIFEEVGLSVETRLIEDVKPEEYIRSIVEQENFDLIVLGSKGHHSLMKEVLLGSVSTNVLKNTQCDILIVT